VRQAVQHKLGPTWAQHIEETRQQIAQAIEEMYAFEGKAAEKRRDVDVMKRHLGVLVQQISAAEKLPPSLTPYKLSADGKSLVGEVELPEAPPPQAPQPTQQEPTQEHVNGMAHQA
jgi:hypothetical protein